MNFYVCMMYSLGVPILVPIVCVSSLVTYWFDKYMFQNFYKTPPNFSHAISFSASQLLIFGVILHLACGECGTGGRGGGEVGERGRRGRRGSGERGRREGGERGRREGTENLPPSLSHHSPTTLHPPRCGHVLK